MPKGGQEDAKKKSEDAIKQQRAINELEAKGVRGPAAALLRITYLEDHIRSVDQHSDAAIKELEAKGVESAAAALIRITQLECDMTETKHKCFLRVCELEGQLNELNALRTTQLEELEGQLDELNKTLQQKQALLAEKILAEDLLADKIIAIRLITDPTVDRATLESVFHYPPPSTEIMYPTFDC